MTLQKHRLLEGNSVRGKGWVAVREFALNLVGTVRAGDLALLSSDRIRRLKDLKDQLESATLPFSCSSERDGAGVS